MSDKNHWADRARDAEVRVEILEREVASLRLMVSRMYNACQSALRAERESAERYVRTRIEPGFIETGIK